MGRPGCQKNISPVESVRRCDFFFEKQRIFDCAFGLFACVSVHSNDLQHLLFQCASHRCATPVVNGSWLILDGITAASADGIAASWPGGKFV